MSTSDERSTPAADISPTQGKTWPPRSSLVDTGGTPPRLDPALIPDSLRPWIVDEAERLGVLLEQIAMPAFVALSALAGNLYRLQPKGADDAYLVPANLAGVMVAPPAGYKTPAIQAGTRFVRAIEDRRSAEHAQRAKKTRARQKSIESRIEGVMKELKDPSARADPAKASKLTTTLENLEIELAQAQDPAPRIIVNDATIEKLLEIMRDNPGGSLQLSDELSALLNSFKKHGRENDRQFYLQALTGTGSFRSDRIGRGTTDAPIVTLSLLGGIQPDVFRQHVSEATEGTGGDGLIARLQLQLHVDPHTLPYEVDRQPDLRALEAAQSVYEDLADAASNVRRTDVGPGYVAVRLDPAAQEHMDAYRKALNCRARSQGDDGRPAFSAHLMKSRDAVARLTLVLYLADSPRSDGSARVTLEQAKRATELMDFFLEHAAVTYQLDRSPRYTKLRRVANYLEDRRLLNWTKAHVIQQNIKLNVSSAELEELLKELEALGWLRICTVANEGARPSTLLELHPDLVAPPDADAGDEQLLN